VLGLFRQKLTKESTAQIEELEERVRKLEMRYKELALDWENAYDRLKCMMGRIAKRAEKLHDDAEDAGRMYPEPAPGPADGSMHGPLTARQKSIQQQILRRRAGG
jgi:hypothetical protein